MVGFGAKKQILVVGNDGVHHYLVSGKKVSLHADLTQSGASLGSDLRKIFKEVDAPLIILFDVVEQQYRRETIPKVGRMDKSKVIQRKLMMAFPQQQFRAFYPLQQKNRDESTVALFAGLSSTLTITQIMDAVLGSEVTIEGTALLPMESTTLAHKLMEETHKRAKTPKDTRWTILMTHHATGGLRQIVIKDGEMALTRLTPLAVNAHDARALVEEMTREFNATLTYLSRFGFVTSDGLDLIVISSPEVSQLLREQRMTVTHLYPLSVQEAGKLLGITPHIPADSSAYGEVIHAGWVGTQRKLVMPLSSPLIDKVRNARQFGRIAIFALLIGIAYCGWQAFNIQADIFNLKNEIADQKAQRITLQNEYDALSRQLNTLKYDPEKTRLMLSIHDELKATALDFEPTLSLIGKYIDKSKVTLQEISIEPMQSSNGLMGMMAPPADPSAPPVKPDVTIAFKIGFVETVSVEEAARLTNTLVENLRARMPGRSVVVTEMVGNLSLDKTVQGVSEQVGEGRVEGRAVQQQTSSLTITGAIE